ncbi:GNAT family N-acetyltransferase [Nocardioides xinjiangensis]|uniref:GNAT family N-acetyltransferase n=1 Tax=Nocardioides xinjiangensis TaxID=2817376 RepID=UPI001B30ED80|nr:MULTISPECIES: GNAT family N-acetyltransferase [unclassified Nocardioides]
MPLTTRPLARDDFDQSMALIREAFGDLPPGTTPPSADDPPRPGYHAYGTFDDDHLVARLATREYHSWFGGSAVPTGGIAGVVVTAERRGEKMLDELFRAALDDGLRERGEAVSTLFCTAPGIYRKFGYEVISSYDTVEVPAATLARITAPSGVRTRRATPADFDALCEVYDAWAAAQNGPLTRRGPSFPADAKAFIDAFTGVTLAVDDAGEVIGFASWDRGQETGDSATLEVVDLLALSGDAYGALWHVLGSFGSVVGQVRLRTSGHDVARLSLPSSHWKAVEREPYMLRVHDLPGAFAGRDWPVDGDVTFSVSGDHLGTTNGAWRLVIERGKATCTPAAIADGPVLTPGGLALAWAGAQTCANLRMAGHLSGGMENDEALDRVLAPRPIHIRDHF